MAKTDPRKHISESLTSDCQVRPAESARGEGSEREREEESEKEREK